MKHGLLAITVLLFTLFIVGCDSVIVAGSGVVIINSKSHDGQIFPLGVPIQLDASVVFRDGVTRTTQYINNDDKYIIWSVEGNEANIDEQGYLDTSGVTPGSNLTITATGIGLMAGEKDSIDIFITDAEAIKGSGVISLGSGNNSDHQYFPAGIDLQLEFSALFTDGVRRSTLNIMNDVDVLVWSLEGDSGATITTEGLLNTVSVIPGKALVIHGTGLPSSLFEEENDVIIIGVTDPTFIPSSALVSINGDNSDGQYISVGSQVKLDASIEFSDGIRRSTLDDISYEHFVQWNIEGSSAAVITVDGKLDTSGVVSNSVLKITAMGEGLLTGESGDISINMTCPNVNGFNLNFTCPMTQAQADGLDIDYQSITLEASDGTESMAYIVQNLAQAKRYCAALGLRLPDKDELWLDFAIPIGDLSVKYSWPTSQNYWTSTKVAQVYYYTFDLSDATGIGMTEDKENYTSCVK